MPKHIHTDKTVAFRRKLRKQMPKAEVILCRLIRNRQLEGLKFRRQFDIGPYIVDFYCAEHRLVIEIDGDSHHWDDRQERDRVRDKALNEKGFTVLRFTNADIYFSLEGVYDKILGVCRASSSSSSSAHGGGEL